MLDSLGSGFLFFTLNTGRCRWHTETGTAIKRFLLARLTAMALVLREAMQFPLWTIKLKSITLQYNVFYNSMTFFAI